MSEFVPIKYFIDQRYGGGVPKPVEGFAFETPGWPSVHACVRFDRRDSWSEKRWIIDHFESGCAIYLDVPLKEDAPSLLANFLGEKGSDHVLAALEPFCK